MQRGALVSFDTVSTVGHQPAGGYELSSSADSRQQIFCGKVDDLYLISGEQRTCGHNERAATLL